jgi:ATP-independent RNA helicase DbpA
MNSTDFGSLHLPDDFRKNLQSLGYHEMTPVQAQSLPHLLEGKDIQAQAKTGSGKTAAFGIALLQQIDTRDYWTQALVLCPTRELADQVSKEIRRLARSVANTRILTLCGGTALGPQLASLQHNPHIVVGTPGRILKHMGKGSLRLDKLKALVLDEADRMLDMGFYEEMLEVIDAAPANRQIMLFSATLPEEIKFITQTIQNKPVDIQVESLHHDRDIRQVFYEVQKGERLQTLIKCLHHYRPQSTVVFCNRKQQCQELADQLWQEGFHATALHGDLEQKQRDQVLVQFANKSSSVLVATDVAARGLDIKDLNAVINYDLAFDPEVHIHRIGRTGRAGKQGLALSLFIPAEVARVSAIEEFQQTRVTIESPDRLKLRERFKLSPPMVTLLISGGRKDKVRAGDILGALTSESNLPGKQVGKIDIFDTLAYVAVERPVARQALKILGEGKIKGRRFRVKKLG